MDDTGVVGRYPCHVPPTRRDAGGTAELVSESQFVANAARGPTPTTDAHCRCCAGAERLTDREREVALSIARGLTSRQIGQCLAISKRTVDAHAAHIRTKLGLRTRAHIAAWATRHRLGFGVSR